MKNRFAYITFIALFLCLSLVLSVGMTVFGESKAGANENLSDKPLLSADGKFNDNYLSDLSGYINDRFFLRQELISLNNLISAELFGVSGSDSIILGKNGWLYYESTLDDYTGLNALSEREIFAAANNVRLMQEYCESKGIKFAFMVAPNKNSLYPQNMPYLGVVNTSLNAKRLHKKFAESGVNYVDIFKIFESEPTLYYTTDSHWNIKGAALAADSVNRLFAVDSDYYRGSFSTIKNGYTGDLYEMLYPSFTGGEDEIIYGGVLDYTTKTPNVQPDSFTIKTESDGNGSILVYRDSFGNNFYPFIADSYGSAEFSRNTVYDLTKDVDYVLVELVERNIPWLLSNLPVFESVEVEVSLPSTTGAGTVTVTESKGAVAPKGYNLWKGTLSVTPDVDSKVYVNCGEAVYEALLTSDNGFAVYLPEGVKPLSVGFELSNIMLNLAAICLNDGTAEPVDPSVDGEFDSAKFATAQTLVGKSVEELYKAIGQPRKTVYLPSCIGEGEDGTLMYAGFSVTTYKDKNGEVIKDIYKE